MNKVVLALILLALVGIVGVNVYRNQASTALNNEEELQENGSGEDRISKANWKTCANEGLGYSVQYPSDWHTYGENSYSETFLVRESECTGDYVLISQYAADELSNDRRADDFSIQYQTVYQLGVAQYEGIDSLADYLEKNPNLSDDIDSYNAITLDEKEFIWVQEFPSDPRLITFDNSTLITIEGNQNISEDIFESMLSTITFTK